MSFPWIFESNFEQGDNSEWDSESDTGSLLDFPHYSELARFTNVGMPWRGAYCMRILPGDTNNHTLVEGDINIADGVEGSFRFYLWHDLEATSDDIFNIFELESTGAVVEVVISLQITATDNLVEIGIGETEAATFNAVLLPRRWYAIELISTAVTGATSTLRVDEASIQTLASHPNLAITDGIFGTQNTLSTTTGTLLLDQFIMDDARVFAHAQRWADEGLLTKSGHVFVGPGKISNITLLSGDTTADNVIQIYDTDNANTDDAGNIVTELRNTAVNETVDPAGMPVSVTRGAYISITGTSSGRGPRVLVQLGPVSGYGSEGAIRSYSLSRKAP